MTKTAVVPECLKDIEYRSDGSLWWTVTGSGRKLDQQLGTVSLDGYRQTTLEGKQYKVHHVVWYLHNGYWPKNLDHINKDKLDNRIENLREGSSVNNHNRTMPLPSSGLPGAHWNKRKEKYKSSIRVDKKEIHLGYFDTAEEANAVYSQHKKEILNV